MKRLTEIDEYGNADIIGMEDETWQMGLSFNDMNKVTLALNRLHRLEKQEVGRMNRQEAAREIDNTACCFSDKRFRDAMHMAANALRGPQPDPITGLVPCGCGGKAKCLHCLTPDGDYAVKCGKCKIMTDWFNSPEDAIKAFNTAMGWKGGAE